MGLRSAMREAEAGPASLTMAVAIFSSVVFTSPHEDSDLWALTFQMGGSSHEAGLLGPC